MGIETLIKVNDMTEEQKQKLSKMDGDILLWICEGRSIGYMSDKLKLHPRQVEHNIDEMLYVLRKEVGVWRFLKTLFTK